MVQTARPMQDATAWATGTFASIDESVADDDDFVASEEAPAADPAVYKLGPIEEPSTNTGHSLNYRYAKTGTPDIDLDVELRQGYTNEGSPGTLIASAAHSAISTSVTAGTISLTTGEADAITYTGGMATDLYVRFVADQAAATIVTPQVLSAVQDTSNTTAYVMGSGLTYTSGVLYLAFVGVHEAGSAANNGSIAGTSQTWTLVNADNAAVSGTNGVACYRFLPGSTLTNATTTWTADSSVTHEGFQSVILQIAGPFLTGGTNGSAAIGDVDEMNASATSASLSITPQANSLVVAFFHKLNTETFTATGGYSKLTGTEQAGTGTDRSSVLIYDDTTPGTTPGVSWTTSANVRGIAVEVLHS